MITYNTFTPVLPPDLSAPFVPTSGDLDMDTTTKSNKSSSESSRVSVGGLDPTMIDYILNHSLPSDARVFFERMESAILNAFNPATGQANLAAYKLLIPEMINLKNNDEAFKKAKEKMIQNDALDEVAISPYGQVYVVNPNATSEEDFIMLKRVDELTPLDTFISNGTLARFRAERTTAAFNTSQIQAIESGISQLTIIKYVNDVLSGIKSNSTSSETYLNVNGEVRTGLAILESYLNGEDLLKQSTSLDENALNSALDYLVTNMPRNMQILLEAHARTSNKNASAILKDYVTSKIGASSKVSFDIAKAKTKEEGSLSGVELNASLLFFFGKTLTHGFTMNIAGSKPVYAGTAHVGVVTDKKGETLDQHDKLSAVFNGQFGNYLDRHNITMGGRLVHNEDRIVLNGNTIESIELPIDPETFDPKNRVFGRAVIRPNLTLLPKVEEAENIIKNRHIKEDDKEGINEAYDKAGLPPKWVKDEASGEWVLNLKYARFAVLTGFADENTLSEEQVDAPDLLIEVTNRDNPTHWTEDEVSQFFIVLENGKTKVKKPDSILSGLIFIPIKDEQLGYENSAIGVMSSSKLTAGQANQIQAQQGKASAKQEYRYVPGGSYSSNNQ